MIKARDQLREIIIYCKENMCLIILLRMSKNYIIFIINRLKTYHVESDYVIFNYHLQKICIRLGFRETIFFLRSNKNLR